MKPRNTLVLLIILILVGGYVYLTQMRAPKSDSVDGTAVPTVEPVLQIEETTVLTITVEGPTGQTRLSRTSANDAWLMTTSVPTLTTASGPVEADPDRASSILFMISGLAASRVLTNVTDLAPFGLVSPEWSCAVETQQGERLVVYLGDKNPLGSSYYAKREGSPNVFLVSVFVGDDLRGLVENPPIKPTPTPTTTAEPTDGTPQPTATPAPGAAP